MLRNSEFSSAVLLRNGSNVLAHQMDKYDGFDFLFPRLCVRVNASHKQETRCWLGCTLYQVDNGYSVAKLYHSSVSSPQPIIFFCTPLSISQGHKMVQRTSEKRRNGRMKPNLTLYCHCYLYSLLHSSVRQAVGHQG
jgi:hypothetical protein